MSILALQQRLVEVGRIRMGEKRTTQSGKTYPAKLGTWRLTSSDVQRLRAVAELYGGEVRAWEDQHEVITTADAIEIALIPGQALSQHMEHWGQEKPKGPVICLRRCDGDRELLKDRACPCKIEAGDDGDLLCKPTTHLMVMLRRVPGIGSWRLSTRGWYAAQELLGNVGLLEQLTSRGQLVPARLRLDQRTVTKADGNKNFVVPVIDIDVALDDVLGGQGLGIGAARSIDVAPVAAIEAPAVPFKPVPVDELPAPPTASTREQLGARATPKPRANAAVPIPSTGVKPRGAGHPPADAPLDGEGADGTENLQAGSGDVPVPSAATVTSDASRVAMWCNDVGIGDDRRAALLHAFSNGEYSSAKDVPAHRLGALRDVLDKIKAGRVQLLYDPGAGDAPVLRGPDLPASDPGPEPAAIQWRALIADVSGIGPAKLLTYARTLAEQRQLELPRSIDEIPASLNQALREWLEEQSAAA